MAKRRSFTAEDSCVLHRPDGYPGRFPARAMTLATRAFLFGTNTKKGAPLVWRGDQGRVGMQLRSCARPLGGMEGIRFVKVMRQQVGGSVRQCVNSLTGQSVPS